MADDFLWHDGERTVRFGRGAITDAPGLLGTGYVLLTTDRALAAAAQVADDASAVHRVGSGNVGDLAGDLLAQIPERALLVALGGGRIVDTAKALAAATGGRAAAIPTTLSAAEMTGHHQRARGAPAHTATVRPAIVINDPALCASQPEPELAASAGNALGHAVEATVTTLTSPVPTLAAREAAALLAHALPADGEPDRDRLALGALLSGYGIDDAWYGLHHVLSQTLRAFAGVGHGPANVVMLPVTIAALRRRAPRALAALDDVMGEPAEQVARRFGSLAGMTRLRDLGVAEARIDEYAERAGDRAELDHTPPRADAAELAGLYSAAW